MRIAKQHGADIAIHTGENDVREAVKSLTGGAGADVIFDPVGGDLAQSLARSTAWNGRWLVIGFAEGAIPKIPLNLPLVKGYSIVGVFWGNWTRREPAAYLANMDELFGWYTDGKIKPLIEGRYPLAEAADVLKRVLGRGAVGKLALVP